MDKAELLRTLENLHEHLSAAEQVDADAEKKLRQVTDDIHLLLDDSTETQFDSSSLASSLREMLLSWEADHPRVAELIGRAANALSNLGI